MSSAIPRPSRRRKLLFALLAFGVFCAAGGILGEVVCRLLYPIHEHYERTEDPILFYRLAADVDCIEKDFIRSHTLDHMRGPTVHSRQKEAGVLRVAWIGDSACFGYGVDDDKTASAQLQQAADKTGLSVESLNFGVVGYNVRQALEVVRQRLPEYDGIDVVIYYQHNNDIINAPWAGLAPFIPSELYWTYERPGAKWKQWLKRSALVHRIKNHPLISGLKGAARRDDTPAPNADTVSLQCASLYSNDNRWGRQFYDDLADMARTAREQGSQFVLVLFPTQGLLNSAAHYNAQAQLKKWADELNIDFIDLTEDYRSADPTELYADPLHPGVEGQRIVSERVLQWLNHSQ